MPKKQKISNSFDPLEFPWERDEKPYFKNDGGYNWYIDTDTTQYAQKENINRIALPNIIVFFIKKDNYITRGIMDKNSDSLIYDDQSLEGILGHIDILKVLKQFKK